MDFEKCGQWKNYPIIPTPSENRMKFTVQNPLRKQINLVKVDGCLIADGTKCDYLFEVNNQENTAIESVLYVELKGKNVEHACQQLLTTVCACKTRHSEKGNIKKDCHIVASRVPPQSNTGVQILRKKLKNCGADLKIHTTQASVSV